MEYFSSIDKGKVAIESTGIWEYIYEIIDALGFDVTLVNPVKTRAIAEAKIKTDSIDAYTLAQLLRADLIPEAYLRDKGNRKRQKILRSRCFYVKMQTKIKNKIHILIDSQEEEIRETAKVFSDLFGKKGLNWLKSLNFENKRTANELLKDCLDIYELFERKKKKSDTLIKKILSKDKECELLMSIPGIGLFLSVLINTEIGAEEDVVAVLKNIEEVTEAYLAYGVYDIVAKIEAPDMETIKRVISEKIRALQAIKTTTTMIAQIS